MKPSTSKPAPPKQAASLRRSKQTGSPGRPIPPPPAIPAAVAQRARFPVELPAATVQRASLYARQHGRTLEQALVEAVEMFAADAPAPAEPAALPLPPLSVTLSTEASAMVRWYVETTHHKTADAVDGAVLGVLNLARAAYEEPHGDESFDCLLRDVLRAQDRRRDEQVGCLPRATVELDSRATTLLAQHRQQQPDADVRDVRDVVSAAVAFFLDDEQLSSAEALETATARRLALENRGEGAR